MKTKTLFLLFAFMLVLPAASDGQVGNLLKNKLNRVVNAGTKTLDKEVNKEIDTAVEKGVLNARDKAETRVENNSQTKPGQPSQEEGTEVNNQNNTGQGGLNLGKLMANKVDLKYNEEYSFSSRIYMQTETYDKKDVLKMDFYMYYSSSSPSVGVETRAINTQESGDVPIASSMVMDGENKCFLMLTDVNGMKMGIISSVPDENAVTTDKNGKPVEKPKPPTVIKTGNSKVIAGYKCEEYLYKDADNKTSAKIWHSKDVDLKIDKRGWSKSGMPAYYGYPGFENGVILAWESYDEKDKLLAKSETKEINFNFPHSISVKGYSLRQMNLNQEKKK
jgi:hypothetical protein